MTKTRKAMLRSSIVMLLVAAMALSSATYAWFTMSNNAAVTDLQFQAQIASGIQISADAATWKSSIATTDIQTADTGALKGILAPVSSVFDVDTETNKGTLKLFAGTVTNDGKLKVTAAEMSDGADTDAKMGYWKFDIYVKNEGAKAKDLYLRLDDETSGQSKSSVTAEVHAADSTKGITASTDVGLQNAVRVAFINQGSAADGTTAKSKDGGTSATVWEPNATAHTDDVKASRYITKDDGSADTTLIGKFTGTAAALRYVGLKAATADKGELSIKEGAAEATTVGTTVYAETAPKTKTESEKTTDTTPVSLGGIKLAALPANQITKITVYIWIEGQDVDCNNAQSTGIVNTALNFFAKDQADT